MSDILQFLLHCDLMIRPCHINIYTYKASVNAADRSAKNENASGSSSSFLNKIVLSKLYLLISAHIVCATLMQDGTGRLFKFLLCNCIDKLLKTFFPLQIKHKSPFTLKLLTFCWLFWDVQSQSCSRIVSYLCALGVFLHWTHPLHWGFCLVVGLVVSHMESWQFNHCICSSMLKCTWARHWVVLTYL